MTLRRPALTGFVLAGCLASATAARAANPCADGGAAAPQQESSPGSGIGGTGRAGDEGGIRGTGRAGDGGIGGTGRGPKDPDSGGIGGTGYVRGIFGTVTGYASLCVAGLEVRTDTATFAGDRSTDGGSTPAIGETVEIIADGAGDSVRAISITASPVLVGPVESIDGTSTTLVVLGQRVVLSSATRTRGTNGDTSTANAALRVGDSVRVSGLRREDGDISASRVDPSSDDHLLLGGRVTASGRGWIDMGSQRLDVSALRGALPHTGDEVLIRAHLQEGHVTVDEVRPPLALLTGHGLRRVDVEAIVAGNGRSVAVGSQRIDVPRGTALAAQGRVLVGASVGPAGTLVFDRLGPPIASRPPIGAAGPAFRQGPGQKPDAGGGAPPPGGGPGGPGGHAPGGGLPPPRPDLGAGPPPRPDRPDRPERPDFPDRPPPRPPRPGSPPPPPPPPPPPHGPMHSDYGISGAAPARVEIPRAPDSAERPARVERPEQPVRPERPMRPERPPERVFVPSMR